MDGVKKWFESSGIWGSIGAIVVPVGTLFGLSIDPQLVTDTVLQVSAIATVVSGLVALWGRWKATAKIG